MPAFLCCVRGPSPRHRTNIATIQLSSDLHVDDGPEYTVICTVIRSYRHKPLTTIVYFS